MSDWIAWRRKLPPETLCEILDAIADYCTFGEKPEVKPEDNPRVIEVLTTLMKWTTDCDKAYQSNLEKGKKGGRPKSGAKKLEVKLEEKPQVKPEQNLGVKQPEPEPNTEIEIKEKTIKKKKPILSVDDVNLGEYEIIRPQVKKWLEYKQQERGERYKTEMSLMVCVKKLYELSGGDPIKANDIVENSIANRYQGLVLPKNSAQPRMHMSFKDMKEMQKEMDIQKVLRGEL